MNKKRKVTKRIAAWFLCLAMVLTTINLPAFTTEVKAAECDGTNHNFTDADGNPSNTCIVCGYRNIEENIELYVYGIKVTEENADDINGDGKTSFDKESSTLYLKGTSDEIGLHENVVIYSSLDTLNIELEGDTVINSETAAYGIYFAKEDSNNTLDLNGHDLTINVGNMDNRVARNGDSAGIYFGKNTLNITGDSVNDVLDITSGTVTSSDYTCGIYNNENDGTATLNIDTIKLNICCVGSNGYSCGIYILHGELNCYSGDIGISNTESGADGTNALFMAYGGNCRITGNTKVTISLVETDKGEGLVGIGGGNITIGDNADVNVDINPRHSNYDSYGVWVKKLTIQDNAKVSINGAISSDYFGLHLLYFQNKKIDEEEFDFKGGHLLIKSQAKCYAVGTFYKGIINMAEGYHLYKLDENGSKSNFDYRGTYRDIDSWSNIFNPSGYSLSAGQTLIIDKCEEHLFLQDSENNNHYCKYCGITASHLFDVEDTEAIGAWKSNATCTEAAKYYKSCEACGAVSTNDADIFEVGEPLGHDFKSISATEHKCQNEGCGIQGNHNFSENGTCGCGLTQLKCEVLNSADKTAIVTGVNDGVSAEGEIYIPSIVKIDGEDYLVTEIDNDAFFYECGFTGNLTIPNSVTTIGSAAFCGCGFDGKLTLGNSVTTIGNDAFYGCGFTGNLTIPNSVTTIGDYAFQGCGFDGKLTLGNSVTTIGDTAFCRCGFTGNLTIPDSVTTLGTGVFWYCDDINSVSIPCSMDDIMNLGIDSEKVIQRDHDFSDQPYVADEDGIHHNQKCKNCDFVNQGNHDFSDQPYVADEDGIHHNQKCKDCDFVNQGNHDFSKQPYKLDKDGKHYQVCANCTAETEHEACTAGKATCTTKATLTTNGKLETKCTVCNSVLKTDVIYSAKTVKLDKVVYTYDGKTKKPSVIIKDSKSNLIPTSNYTVTYPTSSKKVGEYTVKITFKGNYKGSKSLTFKINPVKTAISSLTAGSKSFTVKWAKKTAEVTGYQIQYSTSDKFKTGNKTVAITKNGIVKKQIKNLKAGKKYFVRIRTYKTVGKVKFYSEWSAKKSVTTKK